MFDRFTAVFRLTLLAAVACAGGCTRSESGAVSETENVTKTTEAGPTDRRDFDRSADPAESFNQLFADLAEARNDAALSAVPARYQADIDRLLTERVRPLDPAIRRRIAEAVARFAEALVRNESFVLASERFEIAGPAADALRARFGALCRIIAAAARWPGWGSAEGGDAKSLLAAIASAAGKEIALRSGMKGVHFETVSVAGERATVRLLGSGGAGSEMNVVRVGDAWVPATVEERWDALFGTSGSGKSASTDDLATLAGRLDEVTAALEKVSGQSEFDALADRAATLLLATAAEADRRPRAVRPEEYVTVEILGEMTEEQKDRLVWGLAAHSDEPASGVADAIDHPSGEQGIVVAVGPVTDIAAFAGRLADVTIERIDAEKKTVTARFAGP